MTEDLIPRVRKRASASTSVKGKTTYDISVELIGETVLTAAVMKEFDELHGEMETRFPTNIE